MRVRLWKQADFDTVVDARDGAIVAEILEATETPFLNHHVVVNGQDAGLATPLHDGDIVCLVWKRHLHPRWRERYGLPR